MEPLGTTDSSVEASWDYRAGNWRKDFVTITRDLAPGVVRFGGNFSRYYKWREGVGPVRSRPWTRNYDWGGKETNRVGTQEFVDFCRSVGAEPLYCVNFESDGIAWYKNTPEGNRSGTAQEAADWVSYANDPDNHGRKVNGSPEPYSIKLWQIGNETSYLKNGFTKDQAIAKTVEFAKAMHGRDPSLQLIGWGDRSSGNGELWAKNLVHRAGEYLSYVAIHMMGQSPRRRDTVLWGRRYEQDPERAWQELLELSNNVESRVSELESALTSQGSKAGIAITEGHLSLRPHNINPILYEWLSAVYHARSLNIYQRHGARVRIATAADFQGTRWTVLGVQIPVPSGDSFLMPVASIMRLFKRYNGTQGTKVVSAPSGLDIAASRTQNKMYLHVLNTQFHQPVTASFAVKDMTISDGTVWEIAPDNLREYVSADQPDVFAPEERKIAPGSILSWSFPAGSVSAVELNMQSPS
ncbi:MAG TPA: alpha-L-arabinofuranosidase [Bryobacteraceae bacterium]|nr:alpha-L-arabinofuranosidase [Bryobacteraceae bacterium]